MDSIKKTNEEENINYKKIILTFDENKNTD